MDEIIEGISDESERPPIRPRISVIGTGYLGATHAAAMAELGFDVVGVDADPAKVALLQAGRLPFSEPGLDELVQTHLASGRLRFTTDLAEAVAVSDIHFVCVGTPQQSTSHAADLRFVEGAVAGIARALSHDGIVVGKSTVPVGTAARLRELLGALAPEGVSAELIWNPEFLREGKAVDDTLHPDRVVIGGASAEAEAVMREVYARPISEGAPFLSVDLPTAELVKVSANAFLATKISFINAIAELCTAAGADVGVLADAIGVDARIGRRFLDAGLGFGGGCLPKDIRALMHRAGELGAVDVVGLMQQVDEINMRQRQRVIQLAIDACGGSVLNARIGVLGAAFKPLTDDVRDSPALNVAAALHLQGAQVTVCDPEATEPGRRMFPTLTFAEDATEAVAGAHVVLLLTEWEQFLGLDPVDLARRVRARIIIDARNKLDTELWSAAGWTVIGLGTGVTPASADTSLLQLAGA
ncbi:UDP-glucose/GDP-mannose dehydrogenase family protein [Homoserinibacter sp. GY 40078]|uniref:UDP-glucose dehydrogenase family protein n=1 Tax=Homoserinibacter sp. GY 40078 TaxID=2603275 RepID=UPI0011CB336C|nr:UDP-glucose/GDP-mannose dehydrogenase family protein [Homoserinibacter sp. GY 40078]TXK17468.1 UDP-glucose/GDP-mannose dehydrogenase family protein [Homoserinibacter sp. GY 40078]